MKRPSFSIKPLCSALIIASLLSACGGGGSSPSPGNSNTPPGGQLPPGDPPAGGGNPPPDGNPSAEVPLPDSVPGGTQMTMSCVGADQCSGGSIIRIDNGVALTRSGVQAYGRSTSDLMPGNTETTAAHGFELASGALAEVRVAKNSSGVISQPALLLSNLGITWDGTTERPLIIEAFLTTPGRSQLESDGAVRSDLPLPASANLSFYDYADKGILGTQINYANNRYFPRGSDNPPRCPSDSQNCFNRETDGITYNAGTWTQGGTRPNWAGMARLHGDGDVHAGNGKPDANGNPTILPGGSGIGVPFPGSKGYRGLDHWSLLYSNLSAWVSQDTAEIHEWGGVHEHTKMRRGMVAFGDVTDPATVPQNGSATYTGIAYGWYAGNGTVDPQLFWGAATVTVDFATRETIVTIENTVTYDSNATALPVALKAKTKMGAAGGNVANYLTGPVDNVTMKGGLSGRYFGPVNATGTGGTGPAEVGGTFSLSNSTTRQTAVGGFIAYKK